VAKCGRRNIGRQVLGKLSWRINDGDLRQLNMDRITGQAFGGEDLFSATPGINRQQETPGAIQWTPIKILMNAYPIDINTVYLPLTGCRVWIAHRADGLIIIDDRRSILIIAERVTVINRRWLNKLPVQRNNIRVLWLDRFGVTVLLFDIP